MTREPMKDEILRGGGRGGTPTTARDAWNYAFDELCSACDAMEDCDDRIIGALAGLAWAATAYLMERAAREQDESRREDCVMNEQWSRSFGDMEADRDRLRARVEELRTAAVLLLVPLRGLWAAYPDRAPTGITSTTWEEITTATEGLEACALTGHEEPAP